MFQPPVHASTLSQPVEIYYRLRQGILGLAPAEAGLHPTSATAHVWGILEVITQIRRIN